MPRGRDNRTFRIALVDPRYRQRSTEVTAGHGDVRSSDSTYAPFALAFASAELACEKGERNQKISACTVSRAQGACPRAYALTYGAPYVGATSATYVPTRARGPSEQMSFVLGPR